MDCPNCAIMRAALERLLEQAKHGDAGEHLKLDDVDAAEQQGYAALQSDAGKAVAEVVRAAHIIAKRMTFPQPGAMELVPDNPSNPHRPMAGFVEEGRILIAALEKLREKGWTEIR